MLFYLRERLAQHAEQAGMNEGLVGVIEAQSRAIDLEPTRLLEEIRGLKQQAKGVDRHSDNRDLPKSLRFVASICSRNMASFDRLFYNYLLVNVLKWWRWRESNPRLHDC